MAKRKSTPQVYGNETLKWLSRVKRKPHDLELRLQFADWLSQQHNQRGKLLKLQIARIKSELADQKTRLTSYLPEYWDGHHETSGSSKAENTLMQRYGKHWLGPLQKRGIDAEFRVGLVAVDGYAKNLLSKSLAATACDPAFDWVERLSFFDFEAKYLDALVKSPQWNKVGSLDLSSNSYISDNLARPSDIGKSNGDWNALASVSCLPELTNLSLSRQDIGVEGLKALSKSPKMSRLRRLDLSCNNLGNKGVALLVQFETLPGLAFLDLSQNRLRAPAFEKLANWEGLRKVTILRIRENYPDVRGVRALAESPHLKKLEYLQLDQSSLGDFANMFSSNVNTKAIEHVFASMTLSKLKYLSLQAHKLSADVASVIRDSKTSFKLQTLLLPENRMGDIGAQYLAESKCLSRLRYLDLRYNGISDAGAIAIAESQCLKKLEHVNLIANYGISKTGRQALKSRFGKHVELT